MKTFPCGCSTTAESSCQCRMHYYAPEAFALLREIQEADEAAIREIQEWMPGYVPGVGAEFSNRVRELLAKVEK